MANSAAYMSAFAALVGTFVGGITSIATSWMGQQRQTKEQRRLKQKAELHELYKQFIQDASKLYVDALEHNTTEISKLVDIYATLNRSGSIDACYRASETEFDQTRSMISRSAARLQRGVP